MKSQFEREYSICPAKPRYKIWAGARFSKITAWRFLDVMKTKALHRWHSKSSIMNSPDPTFPLSSKKIFRTKRKFISISMEKFYKD
jgi:hypothetical protein